MIFFKYFSLIFYILSVHVTTKEQSKRENKHTDNPHVFAKCFEDLGCIDVNEKWYDNVYRKVNLEPLDRHTIRTEFLLMKSPKNNSKEVVYDILTLKTETVDISGFKKGVCTKFLIHDFTSNGHTGWVKHLAIAFSNRSDCNVISVDWEAGAEPPFDQAIANARVVALETEVFIKMLKKHVGLTESNIHLVGHGVGAHIAGYVGKNLPGVDRITGLDPTGPSFEKMPPPVRLDVSDATYVEILHTDAFHGKSHGTKDPLGHADFYLNNAGLQPGCNDSFNIRRFTDISRDLLREGVILPACSHKRAFKYYINSIVEQDCKFIGISCENYKRFINGSCTNCDKQVCAIFGLDKPTLKGKQTNFYLNTDSDPPFCMYTYEAIVSTLNVTDSKTVMGSFDFMFVDDDKKVSFATASLDNSVQRTFVPGKVHTLIVYAPPPKVDTIQEAKVKWICYKKPLGFCSSSLYVKDITIKRISLSHESTPPNNLCPELGSELKNKNFVQFVKCSLTTTSAPTTRMVTTMRSTTKAKTSLTTTLHTAGKNIPTTRVIATTRAIGSTIGTSGGTTTESPFCDDEE